MIRKLAIFGRRRRMTLSPILSFPFIPLFLTSLALPTKRRITRSDDCNTQIPSSPLKKNNTRNRFFTSCVFCVPWLAALPLVPVKQKHSNEGRRRATELMFLKPKSKHPYLSFVFLLLDLHLSCLFIRLGCCSGEKKKYLY